MASDDASMVGRVEPREAGDVVLRDRLLALADEDEAAVAEFFACVLGDPGVQRELHDRLGWYPGQDPVDAWSEADPARRPVSRLDWPDAPAPVRRVVALARAHTAELREIVTARGWPGRSSVGEDASDAAWFLAMHADADPVLQAECVRLLRHAVAEGDADPRHLATLTDRVISAERGVQEYGTVAMLRDDEIVFLVPVLDPDGLSARRAALGLQPVAADLAEDRGRGELPYRHFRRTASYGVAGGSVTSSP